MDAAATDRAQRLYDEGLRAFRAGDQARSRALNEESLALSRGAGDRAGEIRALVGLSRVALRALDLDGVGRRGRAPRACLSRSRRRTRAVVRRRVQR